jgi:hypothetical protein
VWGVTIDLAARLLAVFDGNRDVYAVGRPHRDAAKAARGKLEYFPQYEPLTPEVVLSHLRGERLVGVYPVTPAGAVKWFAIDFDAPKDEEGYKIPDTFPATFAAAKDQAQRLRGAGLFVHLERSQSGLGVHVWGFLGDWVPARTVRTALRPLLVGDDGLDRAYPMQDEYGGPTKPGNLIALPYYCATHLAGASEFVTADGVRVEPEAFLDRHKTNPPEVLQYLAEKAPKVPSARPKTAETKAYPGAAGDDFVGRPKRPIVGVLKALSRYGCDFLRTAYAERANPRVVTEAVWYAALGQLTAFERGREIAHQFSAGHPGYSPQETDTKFDHALENRPNGCAFIHEHFPKLACKGCPLTAPYWKGDKPILDLVQAGSAEPTRPNYKKTLGWVRRVNEGEEESGISWDVPGFERAPLRNSELTVIGAPPSVGKTSLLVHAAVAVAAQRIPALVFSAETGDRSLQVRMLSHVAKVDSRALRAERRDVYLRKHPLTAREYDELDVAADTLSGMPIFTEYTSVSADAILAGVERVLVRERIPFDSRYVVFFDYLQFGQKEADESTLEHTARLVRQFKGIAQILDRPVVIFSQLKRASQIYGNPQQKGDDAPEAVPTISDFKDTGRIESDADVGAIIWGPRAPGPTVPRKVTFVKQREGEANFTSELLLDMSTSTFTKPSFTAPPPDRPDLLGEETEALMESFGV